MRITITQDFDSAAEAAEFLARVTGGIIIDQVANEIVEPGTIAAAAAAKKERRPRADAGKKREPYGPRAQNAEGAPTGTQPQAQTGAPVPAVSGGDVPNEAAASSAPKSSASEKANAEVSTSGSGRTPGGPDATPAAEYFPATLDGARKAMKALDQTKGKGMDACIAALKATGVLRISDLKAEQYAGFIKEVLSQASSEGVKAAIEWAKTAQKSK